MTIAVQITNKEGASSNRILRVEELTFDKWAGKTEKFLVCELAPGESRTFHIHLLKDLHLSERTP